MFALSVGKTGKVRFNLLAKNKRVVLTSEAYESRSAALKGIASVKENAEKRERFEVRTAKNGKKYFVLIAKNGEIIGQSQMYAGGGVYAGIRSVMENAPKADVVDAD